MAAEKLDKAELAAAMRELDGWSRAVDRDAIVKRFSFANFSEAFAFMTRGAMMAEKLNHHPEWFNVYKTVDVTLTTHDCGGVSALDIRLAKALDAYAGGSGDETRPGVPLCIRIQAQQFRKTATDMR